MKGYWWFVIGLLIAAFSTVTYGCNKEYNLATSETQHLESQGGGLGGPEFFQTHPDPENRYARVKQSITETFPNGLPEGLI